MKKKTSITLFILSLLCLGYGIFVFLKNQSEFTSSVLPGWHTTIYFPYAIDSLIIGSTLFLLGLFLWKKR